MPSSFFPGASVDDVMRSALEEIRARGQLIFPSKAGPNGALEITGVLLALAAPRARISRTETRGRIFSALGELCWYLAGSNDAKFISYYIRAYAESAEDGAIFGGYGVRLMNWKGLNQLANVTALLSRKKDSRQAVIQLFDALDIAVPRKDVPCTCTLQFMLRGGRFHLVTSMRSNDVHWGLPHDIFCFTMLQEIICRCVSARLGESTELGEYKHAVGSLHLYSQHQGAAKRFLKEGWQPTTPSMPDMPRGDPWPSINVLLEAEAAIREGRSVNESKVRELDPYWADLVRLLQIFRAKHDRDAGRISNLRSRMACSGYDPFISRALRQVLVLNPLDS